MSADDPHAQPFRLKQGGRIDRLAAVPFTFDGKRYYGYQGDSLASALLAHGCHLVGRSFKYHRPRGILGVGPEEPNAIVQLGRGARAVPNLQATQIELFPGLEATSVNRWPTLRWDAGAVAGCFSGLLAAGFYYKTFMWPASAWPLYERFIRRAAGLGRVPQAPDPDVYDKRTAHCDVVVVGAGPSGLAAAQRAGRSGLRVLLIDAGAELGGSLLATESEIDGKPSDGWVKAMTASLDACEEVTVLRRTTVNGYHDHNFLTAVEQLGRADGSDTNGPRERLWRIRARRVILATGAFERPLPFANNDRPGSLLASAVSAYRNRFAVVPGRRAVVATNNDSAYATALDLAHEDVPVTVVDAREDSDAMAAAEAQGINVIHATVVAKAHGGRRVRAVELAAAPGAGGRRVSSDGGSVLACDLVAVSGGWNPAVHLHAQSGGRPRYDSELATFVPGDSAQKEASAGACRGTFDLGACLVDGIEAGLAAVEACGAVGDAAPTSLRCSPSMDSRPLVVSPPPQTREAAKTFVDFQNDTTLADLYAAAREGFHSVEHVKRYTALGFGTDQGKIGNVTGVLALADALGVSPGEVGTTTFRAPFSPVTFGTVAGVDVEALYDPVRKTPLHAWHEGRGAVFEPVGQWLRPRFYPHRGEDMRAAVSRECAATRTSLGVMDASTLGKIDIYGTDAAEFLNRIYANAWLKLPIGRCRYGLMLGEDGMVMDDGVTTRLAEHHYLMTTTTGGAAHVLSWLERWHRTEWPELDVCFTSVTDHWATIALAGPSSRVVLGQLAPGADLSDAAFPFMTSQAYDVGGIAVRVARISFSGELAYELNVAADEARGLWQAVMAAGGPYGITPYGTEAMHVLRAEKGFIIVGQDTDGSVTPQDLGLGRMCKSSADFLGRRSLARSDCTREDRKQLVGLLTRTPSDVIPEGSQLVSERFTRLPVKTEGHVTSSYWSEVLGHSIALALLERGHQRHGERVFAPLPSGQLIEVTVTAPIFYDPDGLRQHD